LRNRAIQQAVWLIRRERFVGKTSDASPRHVCEFNCATPPWIIDCAGSAAEFSHRVRKIAQKDTRAELVKARTVEKRIRAAKGAIEKNFFETLTILDDVRV